jgi:hypothetical protein
MPAESPGIDARAEDIGESNYRLSRADFYSFPVIEPAIGRLGNRLERQSGSKAVIQQPLVVQHGID